MRGGANMTRREIAMDYFAKGYNCCQSVVLAYKDMVNLDQPTIEKLTSSFGGGIGRMREVCGTVSAMAMVAGLLCGYEGPDEGEAKKAHYERIRALADEFREKNGAIVCRELLNLPAGPSEPIPERRTADYYAKRPCKELVGDAAQILEKMIESVAGCE